MEIITARDSQPADAKPLVSAIVINSGGWQVLRRAMSSVSNQTFEGLELLLVDSAFPEMPSEKMQKEWPTATILRSRENLGFCKAANAASALAQGRYLFFVDSRTWLNDKSLDKLVETIETEPDAGIVGPLMLNEDGSLQSVGMKIDQLGQPSANRELFGPDAELVENFFYVPRSAMLINKQLFNVLDGFDEGYFSGLEDADICWRARLLGSKIAINPWAIAFCAIRQREHTAYLQYRNSLRMIIKNYGALRAIAGSTKFVGSTIVESIKSLFLLKPGLFVQYWRALLWNLVMLPSSIRERRHVQSQRLEDDELILRDVVEEEKITLSSPNRAA